MEEDLIDIHLKDIKFKDAEDQKDLLVKMLIYSIGNIETVFESLKYYRVFKNGEEYHKFHMHSEKWMKERNPMSGEEKYDAVRHLISQCDFPLRLVLREVFPYLLYFHGFKLYTKIHHASPLSGVMDNLLTKEHFVYEDEYDHLWNTILDNNYFEDDDYEMAEMIEMWMTYEKNPLQPHMQTIYSRHLKMTGTLQCEKSKWLK